MFSLCRQVSLGWSPGSNGLYLVPSIAFYYLSPMAKATRPRSVLITGANGFVGSRLCRQFLGEGFRVIAGVRKTSDLSMLVDLKLECRYGDVMQDSTLPEMVSAVDYVIHNAGVVKARKNNTFFEVNEKGTSSLFEAIAEHNPSVRRVIYISSLAAAGPSIAGKVITEDDAPHPVSAYGRSKLAGEEAALAFAGRFEVVVLRPSGVYGPGDREVFTFFEAVNRGVRPLLGDLNRKIQMVHVDDLCRAVYLATTKKARSGEVYHIVESQAYTYRELVNTLAQVSGKRCLPVRLPGFLFWLAGVVSGKVSRAMGAAPMLTRDKAVELLTSWEVSAAKARRDFGFESQIPFAEGAKETFDWYRKQGWLR